MEGLSIIIPCYNEASRKDFKKRILHFHKICKELTFPCEIIYIDDGSKDNTYEILSKKIKKYILYYITEENMQPLNMVFNFANMILF